MRDPAREHLNHPSHPISRLGREHGEAAEYPEPHSGAVQYSGGPDDRPNERIPPLTHVPELMSVQYSGGPDDRPNEKMPPLTHVPELMSVQRSGGPNDRPSGRMPPLTHVPELLSAPPSGAGEGTGANPGDDICNNLNPRQPADELAEDDNLP